MYIHFITLTRHARQTTPIFRELDKIFLQNTMEKLGCLFGCLIAVVGCSPTNILWDDVITGENLRPKYFANINNFSRLIQVVVEFDGLIFSIYSHTWYNFVRNDIQLCPPPHVSSFNAMKEICNVIDNCLNT